MCGDIISEAAPEEECDFEGITESAEVPVGRRFSGGMGSDCADSEEAEPEAQGGGLEAGEVTAMERFWGPLGVVVLSWVLSGCANAQKLQKAAEEGYARGVYDEARSSRAVEKDYQQKLEGERQHIATLERRLKDCLEAGSNDK